MIQTGLFLAACILVLLILWKHRPSHLQAFFKLIGFSSDFSKESASQIDALKVSELISPACEPTAVVRKQKSRRKNAVRQSVGNRATIEKISIDASSDIPSTNMKETIVIAPEERGQPLVSATLVETQPCIKDSDSSLLDFKLIAVKSEASTEGAVMSCEIPVKKHDVCRTNAEKNSIKINLTSENSFLIEPNSPPQVSAIIDEIDGEKNRRA